MSELKLCRICLRRDGKMYNCNNFQLKKYYNEIMSIKVSSENNLPQNFCYECAGLLYKYNKFKEKCHRSHTVLKNMVKNGKITYETVKKLDRKILNLESYLNQSTASGKVKTVLVKYKGPNTKIINNIPVIENVDIDNSDNCFFNDDFNYESEYDPIEKCIEEKDEKVIENDINQTNDLNDNDAIKDFECKTENGLQVMDVGDPVSTDDEKALIDLKRDELINSTVNNKKDTLKKKRKKKHKDKLEEKNKFKLGSKKNKFLESNNWSRTLLTEEEALTEFQLRAQNIQYVRAPYKCTECYKGFSQQDMLIRHKKLRHAESLGPLSCRFCQMRFKWKCSLSKHMSRHYTIYKCLRCDLVCNLDTSAEFHENYHNGIIRKCKLCGKEFKHQSTYYSHLRTHRSQHVCHQCGASFVSEVGLHMHKLIKHVDPPKTEEVKKDATDDTYCSRCDIQFDTQKAYDEHLFHSAMHSKGLPDHIEDTPAPAGPKFQTRPRPARRKQTTCSYCGKTFPTQSECMKHHHDKHWRKPFSPNEPRHICEICGASLAAASVIPHLNTHTRERLFDCSTCGIKFSSKSSMTRHMLTHTGEKPYPCPSCDKRFTQTGSVKLHYRTVHLKEPYPKRNRRKKKDEHIIPEFAGEIESESSR